MHIAKPWSKQTWCALYQLRSTRMENSCINDAANSACELTVLNSFFWPPKLTLRLRASATGFSINLQHEFTACQKLEVERPNSSSMTTTEHTVDHAATSAGWSTCYPLK